MNFQATAEEKENSQKLRLASIGSRHPEVAAPGKTCPLACLLPFCEKGRWLQEWTLKHGRMKKKMRDETQEENYEGNGNVLLPNKHDFLRLKCFL